MPNQFQKILTQKINNLTGTMWCSHCQAVRKREGGRWAVTKNGRRKRWKCAQCVENYAAKKRAETVTTAG